MSREPIEEEKTRKEPIQEESMEQEAIPIAITYGYSRDHRADLK